jgi:phage terminase Nu1 subunit (DNA packaging protein)
LAKPKVKIETKQSREVSTSELALIVGKTPQWIRQLTRDRVLFQVGRGTYILTDAVQAYILYASGGKEEDNKLRLVDHKTEHERIKTEIAALELAVMRGELHRADDVKAVMEDALISLRSRLLGLPNKIGPKMLHMQNLAVVTDILTEEIRTCLTTLADYDPEAFKAGVADERRTEEN